MSFTFPRAFLLRHRGATVPGMVLPSGRVVLVDDEDFGSATIAPTLDDLLKSYRGSHIEWPSPAPNTRTEGT
ncbi:hypothetical protein [Streptomyces niveus]|uniref:hypothetical protein n=1 Tax=Streptomyces niveus TaxID=193462 RepID=UPI00369E1327